MVTEDRALLEALALQRAVFAASPLATVVLDRAGIVRQVNPAAERMLGWTNEESLGKPSPGIPDEARDLYDKQFQQALHGEVATGLETVRFTRLGSMLHIRLAAAPLVDSAGNVVGVVRVMEDITDRVRDEATLRDQASLLDLTHDAVFVREFHSDTIQYWNRGAELLYGYSASQAWGRVSHDLLQTVHSIPIDEAKRILVETGSWEGELQHTRSDGAIIFVSSRWALRQENAQPAAILETNTDITARKQAAADEALAWQEVERLAAEREAILHQAAEGILLADVEGCITFVNHAAQRILGVTNLGTPLSEHANVYHTYRENGEPYPSEELPLSRAVLRGEVVLAEDVYVHRSDTDIVILEANAAPLRGNDGTPLGAVATFHDVTLQRTLSRQKDEFLSAAAHDLKAPLAAIKALAQLLQRYVSRPEIDRERLTSGLRQIDSSVARMTGQIDELLDLTRTQMDRPLLLNKEPADLVALARRAIEETPATEQHLFRLVTCVPELMGEWDEQRLERVLSNLLNNAAKYSPDKDDIAVIVDRECGVNGDAAIVTVQDHGIGIPSEDLPHIFDRFYRGRNAVEFTGTGIGLAGVRQIVEQHGGTVSVTSKEGEGSTFTIRLPLGARDR